MSKPVYITADSTCDLTPALLERFHVKTIPLHIVLGEENYLDGVDFTQEMIYERYAKDKVQDLPGVYPVDSLQLTTGMGEMVLAACEMRDEGKDAASIAQAMQDLIGRVNVSFVIDTLEYMWKGGRCTGVTAFGANLLNLKPCIEMRNGKLEVCKKYRGNIEKVYEKYIAERLKGKKVDPRYIFITTSNAPTPELAARLESAVRKAVPEAQEIFFTRTGCTVTSHCGPGTMGVLFLEA